MVSILTFSKSTVIFEPVAFKVIVHCRNVKFLNIIFVLSVLQVKLPPINASSLPPINVMLFVIANDEVVMPCII